MPFIEPKDSHFILKGQDNTYLECDAPVAMKTPANDRIGFVVRTTLPHAGPGFLRLVDWSTEDGGIRIIRSSSDDIILFLVGDGSGFEVFTWDFSADVIDGTAPILFVEFFLATSTVVWSEYNGVDWTELDSETISFSEDLDPGVAKLRFGASNTGDNTWDEKVFDIEVWEGGQPGDIGANQLVDFNIQDHPERFSSDGTTYTDALGNTLDVIGGDYAHVRMEPITGVEGVMFQNPDDAIVAPSTADLNLADTDFIIDVEMTLNDLTPASIVYLITKDGVSGNSRSWEGSLNTNGTLRMYSFNDAGGGATQKSSSVGIGTLATAGQKHTYTYQMEQDTGSGNSRMRFFVDGTQLGTNQNYTGAAPMNPDGTNDVKIGNRRTSDGALELGTIVHRVRIYTDLTRTTKILDTDGAHLPSYNRLTGDFRGRDGLIQGGALTLNGTVNENATTLYDAAHSPASGEDLDVRFKTKYLDAGQFWGFAGRWVSTGSQKSWFLAWSGNGLRLYQSLDGSVQTFVTLSLDSSPSADEWVVGRVVRDGATGVVTLYVSGDEGETWVAQADTETLATGALFDTSAGLEIGAYADGGQVAPGVVVWVDVYVDGTLVASPNFALADETKTALKDAQGNVWTYADTRSLITVEGRAVPLTNPISTRSIAHWSSRDGNGGYAGLWADRTGHGHDAERFNAVYDAIRRAESFNGSNAYFEVPDHPDLNFGDGDSFTLIAVVEGLGGTETLVGKRSGTSTASVGYLLASSSAAIPFCEISDGSTEAYDDAGGDAVLKALISAVRDGNAGRLEFYNDLSPSGSPSVNVVGDITNTLAFQLGKRLTGAYFSGYIHEVLILPYALTAQELEELYDSLLPATSGVDHLLLLGVL